MNEESRPRSRFSLAGHVREKTIFNERRFFESKVTVWVLRRIGFFVNYLLHVVVDIGDFAQSQQLKLGTWRTPV